MITERYLVVGLGNPGKEYERTRHNVGFMCVETLAEKYGLKFDGKKAKAIYADGMVAGRRVILAKPQTYMNLSGEAVRGLIDFYKISVSNMLLIHDDLDIPLGTVRLRPKGSAGGQKGVRSTIQQLGGEDFARCRFGIGRPPGKMDAAAYVLQPFKTDEILLLNETVSRVVVAVEAWLQEGIEVAMNRYNGTAEEVAARGAKKALPEMPPSPPPENPS